MDRNIEKTIVRGYPHINVQVLVIIYNTYSTLNVNYGSVDNDILPIWRACSKNDLLRR
ncbi:hypothetical protein PAE9249_01961 [Paenibacillus sp. CECT 9249]|nr:hypothetical protein PAE9249_01961 [Paenibacillus sp. CECT 9249]